MPRQAKEIDTTPFEPLVAEMLVAAMLDPGICIAMMQNAVVIKTKRRTWLIRTELREAERTARLQCNNLGPRVCNVTEPCGTGMCAVVPEGSDLAELVGVKPMAKGSVRTPRPQPDRSGRPSEYNIESAVAPLLALREERGQLPPVYAVEL